MATFPVMLGTRTRLVEKVADVVIPDGALVFCDLDDTLIFTQKKKTKHDGFRPMHASDVAWAQDVAARATLIYLTSRPEEYAGLTTHQLAALNFPTRQVMFAYPKGPAVSALLALEPPDRPVFFLDDLDESHRSVEKHAPSVQCFRVDPRKARTVTRRLQRRAEKV